MFIRQLPPESATSRALAGEDAPWTLDAQLLAACVDSVNQLGWVIVELGKGMGAFKPSTANALPASIRGPKPEPPRKATREELVAFFGGSVTYEPS